LDAVLALQILRDVSAFLAYVFASATDLKSREVEPRIWIFPALIGMANAILEVYTNISILRSPLTMVSIVVNLIVVSSVAVMAFLRLMGGADLLAVSVFVMLYPFYNSRSVIANTVMRSSSRALLPPLLDVLFVSFLITMFYTIINAIHNLIKLKQIREAINADIISRLIYLLAGRFVTVRDYCSSRVKFCYPLYVRNRVARKTFDVNEDFSEWQRIICSQEAKPDELIICEVGVPYVTLLGVAIIVFITTDIRPLNQIIMTMLGIP